jgi:hypothetical protein
MCSAKAFSIHLRRDTATHPFDSFPPFIDPRSPAFSSLFSTLILLVGVLFDDFKDIREDISVTADDLFIQFGSDTGYI